MSTSVVIVTVSPGNTPPPSHSVESDSDSDDEFFDADHVPESLVLASPSVSVPLTDDDPSDVEEDPELHEENDTSSEVMHTSKN